MEKLKIDYRIWNFAYYYLDSEETSRDIYEWWYRRRVARRVSKQAKAYTLEQWAHLAYDKNRRMTEMAWEHPFKADEYNHYLDKLGFRCDITALLAETGEPYAFLTFLGEGCTVAFLDEMGRIYMSYRFDPTPLPGEKGNRKGYVFLYELSIRRYHKEKDEYGDWDYDYTDYEFTPDGRVRKIEEINDEQTISDAAQRVNVASNWQKYPEFGDWMPLFEMKRWKDNELQPLFDASKRP